MPPHAKRVFKGLMFDTYQWEQEMFDGTKVVFEKLRRPDTVVVFPVLPDGKIVLIKEEQPGSSEIYMGPLGGRVDKGEDAINAARRELLEESGYEAEEMILWYARQVTTKIDWVVYVFIAKGLKKVSEPALDPGEKIKPMLMTLDEFINKTTNVNEKVRVKFGEDKITIKFLQAKLDPRKREELNELFKPLEK